MLLYLPRLPGDQEVAFSEEAETPKQRGRLCVGRRGWAMTLTQERAEAGRGPGRSPRSLGTAGAESLGRQGSVETLQEAVGPLYG